MSTYTPLGLDELLAQVKERHEQIVKEIARLKEEERKLYAILRAAGMGKKRQYKKREPEPTMAEVP